MAKAVHAVLPVCYRATNLLNIPNFIAPCQNFLETLRTFRLCDVGSRVRMFHGMLHEVMRSHATAKGNCLTVRKMPRV